MISDRMPYIAYLRRLITKAKESKNPSDIAEFTRFDKDYLPILFDFYTTEAMCSNEEDECLATLDIIKMYLTIARPELPQQLFEYILGRFTSIKESHKNRMLDLICVLIPYQSVENIETLYVKCIKTLPEIKHDKEQKRVYRLLEEICGSQAEGCKEFLQKNMKSVKKILRKSLDNSTVSSMGPRLRCLNYLLKSKPQFNHGSKIFHSAITEAVICCKHVKPCCRVAAYELLNTIGEILQSHGEMQAFVTMILGGFAGPPLLISATILALAFILHKFTGALGKDNIQALLENVLNLMSAPTREIVDSCLSYLNVFCTSMPSSVVAAALPAIIKSFCGMSEDCKGQFRLKIRYLLDAFVRMYGCDFVIPHVPTKDRIIYKYLHNLRKLHSKNNRKDKVAMENESIEEILIISDSDVDENEQTSKNSNKYNKRTQNNSDTFINLKDAIAKFSDNNTLRSVEIELLHGKKRKRSAGSVVSGAPASPSSNNKPGKEDCCAHESVEVSESSKRNTAESENKAKKVKNDINKLVSHTELPLHRTVLNERSLTSCKKLSDCQKRDMNRDLEPNRLLINKDHFKYKFAQAVAVRVTQAFNDLLDLLIQEEKLEILQRNGINPTNMSSILHKAGSKAVEAFNELYNLWFDDQGNITQYLKTLKEQGIILFNMSRVLCGAGANATNAFKSLFHLWFDENGNKTKYLKTLEGQGINLRNMNSILSGSGANAAKSFQDLYNLWFDANGNKTKYLKTLEREGIKLNSVSAIIRGTGAKALTAFKDLYNLWFDTDGNKTLYLKTLEKEGINLANVSSILRGARCNAAEVFKDLYYLWFDANGNKTKYLKTLADVGINLSNMSGILNGAGGRAVEAYKKLYDVWFDAHGKKTHYLKTLDEKGINLARMTSILSTARNKAGKAFKDLYNLWFDAHGNKTIFLKTLEAEGINLGRMSSILSASGANAANAFAGLYFLWFDACGNKTKYLKTLEKEGVSLSNVSSILHGAGASAPKAFENLYHLWFDTKGNKTTYLKTLEKEGVNLSNMTTILHGARANAAKSFKELYNLWFDPEGNKTQYLKTLEREGISLSNMSTILEGARENAVKAFKDLYNLWFDADGNKTQYFKSLQEKKENKIT